MIFSTHTLHPEITESLKALGRYQVASRPTEAAILEEGGAAEILIVRAPIPAAYFDRASRLRAAIRHGAGLDMIPVEAASEAGVLVANVPGVNAVTVAEHVVFSAIALLRGFRRIDRDLRENGWEAGRRHADDAHELTGRTVGIVGMGSVGRAVFQLFHHGFSLPVVSHTRRPDTLPRGAKAVSMDALVAESDIVVLCCPLTEATQGLLSADRIAAMKPGAILINVSRGPVVDEPALITALDAGRIGGAALDVFTEQPLPPGHPFFALDSVILTPHMAGITEESMLRMGRGVVAETHRILAGEMPENFCNPEAATGYRKRFP